MEEVYKKLRAEGHNTVDKLAKYIEDAHVLEGAAATNENIKKHFDDVADKANVGYEKFISVLEQVANENHSSLEVIKKKLLEGSSNFFHNIGTAANAAAAAVSGAAGGSTQCGSGPTCKR